MYTDVFPDHANYAEPPYKFEAGTPAVGDAIAFGAAVNYLSGIGMDKIYAEEAQTAQYLFKQLSQILKC